MKFLEFYVNSSQFMCGFLMAWRKVSMKNFLNFSNLKFSDYEAKKCAFFKMLIQILRLARQIPVPQTHELLMVWEKIFSHFYFLTPNFSDFAHFLWSSTYVFDFSDWRKQRDFGTCIRWIIRAAENGTTRENFRRSVENFLGQFLWDFVIAGT